jgi:hypothetical protein
MISGGFASGQERKECSHSFLQALEDGVEDGVVSLIGEFQASV